MRRYFRWKKGGYVQKFAKMTFCLSCACYISQSEDNIFKPFVLWNRQLIFVHERSRFLHKSCLKWNSFLSEDTPKNHFLTCKNRFWAICSNFVRLLYGLVDLHSLLSQSFDDVSWRPWKGGDKIVFLHKICTLIFLVSSF